MASSTKDEFEIRADVHPPSLALIIVGLMMIVGHAIAVAIGANYARSDVAEWLAFPGMIVGGVMFVGGISFRLMWSRSWSLIGAYAGLLPVSPGWLITAAIRIWSASVLDRPHIRRAFIDRDRQRSDSPEAGH